MNPDEVKEIIRAALSGYYTKAETARLIQQAVAQAKKEIKTGK